MRWFDESEVVGLTPRLVTMLDQARGLAKVPFLITSGRRTPEGNQNTGGVEDSSHLSGEGVDVACHSSYARYRMVSAAYVVGFRRIGVYDKHLHLDVAEGLPLDVLWVGMSK